MSYYKQYEKLNYRIEDNTCNTHLLSVLGLINIENNGVKKFNNICPKIQNSCCTKNSFDQILKYLKQVTRKMNT